nr:site-specific integrase [Myroides pelagicus]
MGLTYKDKRKQFATGLFVKPKLWQNTKQKVHPPTEENEFINSKLSLIKNKINQAFLFLELQKTDFSVEQIYKQYIGETQDKDKSLIDAFYYHNNRMKKLIDIEISLNTLEKYIQTLNHLIDFLWFKYKKKDFLLKELRYSFITDFEFYLKTEKKFQPNTIIKTIQRFRRVIKVAIAQEYLFKDPFILYKPQKQKKEIIYLNQAELKKLENYNFSQKRIERVRDMFVFCCYTGLAYNEMNELSRKHIIKEFDNNLWIKMTRRKTSKTLSIPLLPRALELLKKLENKKEEQEKLLPKISNQRFNSYLKEIAFIVGIDKLLTHHTARKTFATTVLLYNDVPIEIVSKLLGHSKITMTQEHYGKIVNTKVSEHINRLSSKLK